MQYLCRRGFCEKILELAVVGWFSCRCARAVGLFLSFRNHEICFLDRGCALRLSDHNARRRSKASILYARGLWRQGCRADSRHHRGGNPRRVRLGQLPNEESLSDSAECPARRRKGSRVCASRWQQLANSTRQTPCSTGGGYASSTWCV